MKKLFGIGVVVMLAFLAPRTSHAVGGGDWSCNTTCRDSQGFEYVQVSYGGSPDQAYQNLSCQGSDTVSGDINCWDNRAY